MLNRNHTVLAVFVVGLTLTSTAFVTPSEAQPVDTTASPHKAQQPPLALQIKAKTTTLHVGEKPEITVTIENQGNTPVTLIQPGDGSDYAWRTPIISWSAIDANNPKSRHPNTPPLVKGGRCGNINPLSPQEVFTLAPGKRQAVALQMEFNLWRLHSSLWKAGTYKVVCYYTNDTTKQWSSIPGQPLPLSSAALVKNSTPCTLRSNELVFTVQP